MLNDYNQIVAGMARYPWLITQDSLEIIVEIVNKRLNGEAFTDEEIAARLEAANNEKKDNPRVQTGGGVGIVSVYGPMFPKSNMMTELSGATSLEAFRNDLESLVNDDSVKQIVMDMDTPGGSAFMVPETGTAIRKAAEVKPVYAIANQISASGGLWLGSQATKFYSTPSGKVGSLGVYTVHEDISGADEKLGRKISFISAGEYKTEGNEHEPLSDKARAYIQENVDETMQSFIEAVAEGRNLSIDQVKEYANGKIYNPPKAKEIGMIDDVVEFDTLIESLVKDNIVQPTAGSLAKAVNRVHSQVGGELLSNEEFSDPGEVQDHPELNPDDAADGGWRVDTPPAGEDGSVPDRSGTVTNPNAVKGGDKVNETELLNAIRESLGLDEKGDIVAAIKALNEEVEPVRDLKTQLDAKKKFAEEYPEEHARLQRLEKRDQEHFAQSFAKKLEDRRIERTTGEGDEQKIDKTTLGLSALAIEAIEAHAKQYSENAPTFEGFTEVLDALFQNGIVDYGTKGSSQVEENDEDVVAEPGSKDARTQFAAKVNEIMEQDKVDHKAALVIATKKFPQLAEAWRQPPVAK